MLKDFSQVQGDGRPAPLALPGIGDIIVEYGPLSLAEAKRKCPKLARCNPRGDCSDVNICPRDRCRNFDTSGCHPRYDCDNFSCRDVTIKAPTIAALSDTAARLRKQMASHLVARRGETASVHLPLPSGTWSDPGQTDAPLPTD
jgi:hypothetical protein